MRSLRSSSATKAQPELRDPDYIKNSYNSSTSMDTQGPHTFPSLDLGKGYEWTEIRIIKLLTGLKGPRMNKARLALKRYIVLFLFNTMNVCEEITTQKLRHQ